MLAWHNLLFREAAMQNVICLATTTMGRHYVVSIIKSGQHRPCSALVKFALRCAIVRYHNTFGPTVPMTPPQRYGLIKSFNGKLRDECQNKTVLKTLRDAQQTLEEWRKGDNRRRPPSALEKLSPKVSAQCGRKLGLRSMRWTRMTPRANHHELARHLGALEQP